MADAYPVTSRNRLRRRYERGRYDRETVHAILDAAMVCHIAYVIDGQPFCTPDLVLARRRPAVLARLLRQPNGARTGEGLAGLSDRYAL